ncbi:PXA domain protein 1 [Aspergillus udagawae]|uniref:PXA domain protein 1 n=1 Tax=Aspergillus udagawae TaxID=91492 RepID=A0ABQ1BES0_9EURO|nr:PXA domain protein 1 [Aspergillus udagawae]GFG19580.1 PXA domain protein 1 [Aspergillus udagawae]
MTSESVQPGLTPLSHLKAVPTTSSSKPVAFKDSSVLQAPPQLRRRTRSSKNVSRDEPVSATSDKATVALIRRVLCPQAGNQSGGASTPQPLEELLPPLTSSNEVDLQLYALIAVIIKEFVFSWYSKITSDQNLVKEVIQVIAHCTRALEQRLRETDIAQLILDEIPGLIEAHIISYRLARDESTLSGLSPSVRETYHALHPHPSLSPIPNPSEMQTIAKQRESEAIYRQLLVHGMLAVLLPTEDLENVPLRTIIGDILADLILGNAVSGKMCQGWFLWETTTKLLPTAERRDEREEDTADNHQQDRLHKFGLLDINEASKLDHSPSQIHSFGPAWLWNILQYLYLTYIALQFIVMGLFRVMTNAKAHVSSAATTPGNFESEKLAPMSGISTKRPILNYRIYSMVSQMLDIPRRMPWLAGFLSLFQYLSSAGPGKFGEAGSVVDRFLHETIQDHILTPTLLPNLLRASRAALFPSNARPSQATDVNRISAPAPQPPQLSVRPPTPTQQGPIGDTATPGNADRTPAPLASAPTPSLAQNQGPSAPEIAAIKRECARRILSLVPQPVARVFFGVPGNTSGPTTVNGSTGDDSQQPPSRASSPVPTPPNDTEVSLILQAIERDILDLFADEYCNKHLIYSIIETVLVKLVPELSDHSIAELMEDRGIAFATDQGPEA